MTKWLHMITLGTLFHICKSQGRIQGGGGGGGAPGARPPKIGKKKNFAPPSAIGKNMIFCRKIVIFSHEIPQKFSRLPPLGAIFLSAPPLT
jgi:hypothetical protein